MPNIIRTVCDEYAVTTSYMKFIAFFRNIQHMNESLDQVVDWYKQAYPNHTVSVLKISSQNNTEKNNVEKLNDLKPVDNHIDIIACIDMINMGYHVDNLAGIVMYRGTKSNTIFVQQLGRALSAGANNSAIVFDVVDNLHRKAIYELRASLVSKRTKTAKSKRRAKSTFYKLDEDTLKIVAVDSKGKKTPSMYHIDDDTGLIYDNKGNLSTLVWDSSTNEVYDNGADTDKDINVITKECLNAVGHMATYRELIAKAVAEPMTQRCKFALEMHFRSWCLKHKIKYPISDSDLEKLYGRSKNEFYAEFCDILRDNKIAYPLQDAKELLAIGENDSTDVPLRICAKARNVSIKQILDVFGLTA
jgi:superfamily II DNA or RNA helicase